jgi:hypothetical protein
MARARKNKSSISAKISRPYVAHHSVALSFSIHRNANGRLGSSTSHTLSQRNTTSAALDSPEDFEATCHLDGPVDGPDNPIEVANGEKDRDMAPVVSGNLSVYPDLFCLHATSIDLYKIGFLIDKNTLRRCFAMMGAQVMSP